MKKNYLLPRRNHQRFKRGIGGTLILSFLTTQISIFAQSPLKTQLPSFLSDLVYTDGNISSGNYKTGTFTLAGDATLLLNNIYISANKIIIQKNDGLITAEGNVKLIYDKEKAVASRVIYDISTKQMRMDNAQIFSDPKALEQKYSEEALGLTIAEIAFDSARQNRIHDIKNELSDLREKYVNLENIQNIKGTEDQGKPFDEKTNEITRRYGQLLARLSRTQYQPNVILAALPEEQQEKFLARRQALEKFNHSNPDLVHQTSNFSAIQGYIKVSAAQIIQKDENTFILDDGMITPCHCSPYNEPPLFGFNTQNAMIEMNNYITMKGVTLNIFSVPVFYTPALVFPIKTERTSGFLLPTGYMSSNAGQQIGIPFFLVLGPHADSTITYENFSQRGSLFDAQLRTKLSADSNFRAEGKFIQDKLYQTQRQANSALLDRQIASTTNSDTSGMYQGFRGKNVLTRGYAESSINIPVTNRLSLKVNEQYVTDNNYLSDFSTNNINVNPIAAVYGDTSSASRRFLNQEFSAEYYGDDITFSVRGQGMQDLFAQDHNQTPLRLPRAELYLLPKQIFNSPFIFSNNTTFEHIIRPSGAYPVISSVTPTFIPSTQNGNYISGEAKTINEPFLQGNRLYSNPTLLLPLPTNDYVNANVSATTVGTQYYFPATVSTAQTQPSIVYTQYNAHLDVPFYGALNFKNSEMKFSSITQNFTPFVDINYLPSVIRSVDYPNTYQLWYAQDGFTPGNAVPAANLRIGATTGWTLKKEEFISEQNTLTRLPEKQNVKLANLDFFALCIKEKGLNISTEPVQIFQFSSEKEAGEIFDLWAKKELHDYYQKVTAAEFKQNYLWPTGNAYEKRVTLSVTPLSLTVSTGYNFLADKSAEEINNNAGPTAAPVPKQKYLDILGNAQINLSPLFPASGSFTTTYSQVFHRVSAVSSSAHISFPYGFVVSYSNNQQYVVAPANQINFVEKTQQAAGLTYTPITWLQFGYQWAKSVDPTTTTDTSGGRGYASSQNISFLNFQDCFDLILSRNKAAGIPENQSTYAIGFNLKIFGYTRNFNQAGDYLNRRMQGENISN